MSEKYFPFNSVSGDREYSADDFAGYFGDIIAPGVSANGDNLPVTSSGGLSIAVGKGYAWIKGHIYENTTTKALAVAAGGSLPRIDRVVARYKVADRKIEAMVVPGTAASQPAAPALVRTADFWDIGLATISVPASAISITNSNITDTRTDNAVCGVVRCLVETLDVGAFMKNCAANFDAWLATLKYVLDGDVAGHLQNEIDAIKKDLADGVYSTSAILNLKTVPGAKVTLTLGTLSLTATASAAGAATLYPNKLGTWAVKVVTATQTYNSTLAVNNIGIFDASVPSLSSMSWADIDAVGKAGAAASVFAIGDEKDVVLAGETITLRIEDFNHDDKASGGKAPITFGMKNLLAATQQMNSGNTNSGGWNSSAMRSRMSTYLSQLPADLRAVIKPVVKKATVGNSSTSIQSSTDSLWLFSCIEVGLHTTEAGYNGEGTTYPLFIDNNSRIKKLSNGTGGAQYYWERSPYAGGSTSFRDVFVDGSSVSHDASTSFGVAFGLCV